MKTNKERLVKIIDRWFWTKKAEPTSILADRILESLEVCRECGGAGWYAQQVSQYEQEQRRCENCQEGIVVKEG